VRCPTKNRPTSHNLNQINKLGEMDVRVSRQKASKG
jgi:hypothetical protein